MAEDEQSNSNEWVEDAEYSPKSEFSKAEVVQEAVKKCINLRAKEMKQGYFNTLFSKEGLPLKTWVEDSRKAYCSSIQALRSLTIPEIIEDRRDGKGKEKEDKKPKYVEIDMEACFKKYCYSPIEVKEVNGENKYTKSNTSWIPEIDEKVGVKRIYPDGSIELIHIIGYWNSKVNAYWNDMVLRHDLLFEELIKVIHRKNYFKPKTAWG